MVRDQGLSVSEVCGRWSWVRRPFGGGSRRRFHPDVRTSALPSQRTFARRFCSPRPRPKGDSGRVALRDHCRFQSGPQRSPVPERPPSTFVIAKSRMGVVKTKNFQAFPICPPRRGVERGKRLDTNASKPPTPAATPCRRLVVTDQKIDGHRLLYL
jgi:hypothetical protein